MNGECANDGLSQPRGSTNEELRVCQSSLSQERGSPHDRCAKCMPEFTNFDGLREVYQNRRFSRKIPAPASASSAVASERHSS